MIERTTRLLLFIAGCIAVLVAAYSAFLYSAATKADIATDFRTGQLLRGEAAHHRDASLAEMEQIALSDRLFGAVQDGSKAATFESLCDVSKGSSQFVTIGMIGFDGEPLFLCEGGQIKEAGEHRYIFDAIAPLLNGAFQATLDAQKGYGKVFPEFVYLNQYVMLAERPYLAVAALVAPSTQQPLNPDYRAAVTFGFSSMRTALQGLEAQLAIADLRLEESPTQATTTSSVVLEELPTGNTIIAEWEPSFAFRGQLVQALPIFLSLTLTVLLGVFVFMRRIASLQRSLMAQEADMRHLALHDMLTGLPNRANFVREASAAIEGASAASPLYIGLFDLDRFKQVNDSHGHDAGDRLIIEAARRASLSLGPNDLLARLGGDEYALILRGAFDDEEALSRLNRLGEAISAPFALGNTVLQPSASVGATRVDHGGVALDEALKMADIALYEVKSNGRAHVRLFRDRRADRRESIVPMAHSG